MKSFRSTTGRKETNRFLPTTNRAKNPNAYLYDHPLGESWLLKAFKMVHVPPSDLGLPSPSSDTNSILEHATEEQILDDAHIAHKTCLKGIDLRNLERGLFWRIT
jgi:hypothetical protein